VCTENTGVNSLYSLFYLAYILQRYLIDQHALFIRGSITEGLLYIDENYIFGSGLICAYELENEIAVYPRIILDKNLSTDKVDKSYPDKLFCLDGDGYYFIDYLKNRGDGFKIHEKHKDLVKEELSKNGVSEKIYQKYLWCREYHNRTCKKYNLEDMIII
jgi:hypothetical protein